MITVYLSTNGNAREVAAYYQEVFETEAPYIMNFNEMPEEDQGGMTGMEQYVVYANVKTFGGDIMLSDNMPGEVTIPTGATWIAFSHDDLGRLRKVFDRLGGDGEVIMPMEKQFFNPQYGQVKDKYGFYWMIMSSEE